MTSNRLSANRWVLAILCVAAASFAGARMSQETKPATETVNADRKAITQTALDYVDGYYTVDPDRMTRALHPKLAKRISMLNEEGEPYLREMTAEQLIELTASGSGNRTPPEKQRREITILDVYGDVASVRADMHDWIDYMHMAKIEGHWVIVNVLWEPTPEAKARWKKN